MNMLLREAESVEIISLMDNFLDFLSSIPRKEIKNFRGWVKKPSRLPIAEHGFSMLIRVSDGNNLHSVLFDTSSSPNGVITNAKRMRIDLTEIECIALSHGHYDHFGGLSAIARAVKKDELPIIVHEDAFKIRGVANPDGTVRKYPKFPGEEKVKPAKYVRIKRPYLIAGGLVLLTGEIPRKTEFEKGYPRHMVFLDGKWRHDPWIRDDQALVINLKRKGLVVISGCAHAGIINTVLYAQEITGVRKIYAILGGFHLSGRRFELRIDRTVEELKKLNPKLIAPSHCTGWRGICKIAEAMPDAFIWNSVGNLYRL